MTDHIVIKAENVRKVYGSKEVVKGISFEIMEGEIFGIVGPNGAGKTTLIEILEGIREPDGGHISVKGLNPVKDRYLLSSAIGVQFQESELPPHLRLWEAIDLYASFYSRSADQDLIMQQLGLSEHKYKPFSVLSGGQKQRLFAALALINDPDIVFLDELTTGLDPHARHATWEVIRDIRSHGKTIFLTTHFMEEAELLCDRVAIIDKGKLIALDKPRNLIKNLDVESKISFCPDGIFQPQVFDHVEGISRIEWRGENVLIYGKGHDLLTRVINRLNANNLKFRDLAVMSTNLEDVFLALTGKELLN